eukprot:CAMPEP_0172919070 /NCGR_PEP_ID=MMETSP1075-20121228/201424_1 /TAXON_ID=2916 /ORGANISM="Ceratium fusus, Strain PA161109" /LENGTH=128 /DNA_ID=CAMNT_0013778841 /DNA_START=134 /DNA_END=517 /DNA_ORIENTATION=-
MLPMTISPEVVRNNLHEQNILVVALEGTVPHHIACLRAGAASPRRHSQVCATHGEQLAGGRSWQVIGDRQEHRCQAKSGLASMDRGFVALQATTNPAIVRKQVPRARNAATTAAATARDGFILDHGTG